MILKSAIIADKQYVQTTCRERNPNRGALSIVEAKIRNLKSSYVTRRNSKLTQKTFRQGTPKSQRKTSTL